MPRSRSRLAPAYLANALALAAVSAAACAPLPVPGSAARAQTPEARADAAIKTAMAEGPFPGISVAVARGGKIIYQRGFGVADRDGGTAVTPETRFPIGSITKPVTCLAVLQLVGKGRVALDAPAGRYLPDLPEPSRGVTVRQLLEHTAGVPNYLENPDFPYGKPVGFTRKDMLGFFADKPLMFPAGTRFNYSNSDTYLLGLIAEAASGDSYDGYVAANIFKPFGMTHSDFGASSVRASGYLSRGGAYRAAPAYDWLVPFSAGAIVSTSGDLVRFSQGLFGGKTPAKVRNMALSGDKLEDGSANAYLQGCLIAGDLDGKRKYSHPGSIYGFSSHLAYYPDDRLTVVVLTNSQGERYPPLTLEHRIARIFLGLPEPDLTATPFDAAEAAWIAGDYRITNRRLGFEALGFVVRDGALQLSYGGAASGAPLVPLTALGGGRYVSTLDSEQIFAFTRAADGSVTLTMRYYDADFPMRKAG
ncbi:serine hydrolase domain-containing protein [Sphingomonas canadensis]|uniref:Serine hydrolase domain-containing protein n=1 Tax=Sphingomonas canadensis TaxID=1219257 RepID=A0ABW3H222_9SPHN|nr:serine hydrolase domain-containing protein [Sphingomonas canadensis]MCW3834681.1 beta-lactamase family protein [Sphingomonas canadensis]